MARPSHKPHTAAAPLARRNTPLHAVAGFTLGQQFVTEPAAIFCRFATPTLQARTHGREPVRKVETIRRVSNH
jgi:hypothetical protein